MDSGPLTARASTERQRRVEMWRGGGRSNISVAAPFVWRCLTGSAVAPFPHPAHRTGLADCPHPALGQDFTPSPTTGHDQAGSGVRGRSARKGAGVDKLRPCVARPCVHAAASTPVQRLGVVLAHRTQPCQPSPEGVAGSACTSTFSRLARRIAVGTPITGRPPHRSGLARLRHPAPTLGV